MLTCLPPLLQPQRVAAPRMMKIQALAVGDKVGDGACGGQTGVL